MIIETEATKIKTHGMGTTQTFSIKATAESFRILSSSLYSDKILAILREIGCNARDAHAEAGCLDTSFEVHMPNYDEPWLAIRDFGTGLSKDDIMELYTQYFNSTKLDRNTQVGCLGLGSKSPFSYTKSFTVTSWFGGERTIYTAFINEEGFPTITSMFSAPMESDERCGLEVQVPINVRDFDEVLRKTAIAYEFFDPKPVVTNKTVAFRTTNYSHKTDLWGVREKDSPVTGLRAIMGGVAYRIDRIDPKGDDVIARLQERPLDLFFEIGEVEMAASREALSLVKRTIDAVRDRLYDANDAIMDIITSKIKECSCLWDAYAVIRRLKFNPMFKDSFSTKNLTNILGVYPNFELKSLVPDVKAMVDLNALGITLYRRTSAFGDMNATKLTIERVSTFREFLFDSADASDVTMFVSDVRDFNTTVKAYFATPNSAKAIMVVRHVFKGIYKEDAFQRQLGEFLKLFGVKGSLPMLSSLPQADIRERRERAAAKERIEHYRDVYRVANLKQDNWSSVFMTTHANAIFTSEEQFEKATEGKTVVYIPTRFMSPVEYKFAADGSIDKDTIEKVRITPTELHNMVSSLAPSILDTKKYIILGVKYDKVGKIADKTWINMFEHMASKYIEMLNKVDTKALSRHNELARVYNPQYSYMQSGKCRIYRDILIHNNTFNLSDDQVLELKEATKIKQCNVFIKWLLERHEYEQLKSVYINYVNLRSLRRFATEGVTNEALLQNIKKLTDEMDAIVNTRNNGYVTDKELAYHEVVEAYVVNDYMDLVARAYLVDNFQSYGGKTGIADKFKLELVSMLVAKL